MKPFSSAFRTCVSLTAGSLCFTILTIPGLPQTTLVDLKSQTRGVDFSNAPATKPFKTGTALPLTCNVGESFFKLDAAAGQNLYGCTTTNTWTSESGGGLPVFTGNADRLLGTNGIFANWLALGGDISGAPQSLLVNGLQGRHVAATTPTDGQVLRWNSGALNWEPGTVAAVTGAGSPTNTGGDLSGLISNATVTRMQNKPISSTTPSDGQVLTWNLLSGQWQPQTPASGTGGGASAGVSNTSALGVTFSSANTITIGSGCSVLAPCNVRFGNNVIGITNSATVTWQSGSGTVFIYAATTGTITVGSNLTLACSSACQAASGVSSFPANSIPLFTWRALSSGWDPEGGHDSRAYLSSKILSAGPGIILIESGQQSTVAVDTTLIPTYTTGSATLTFGTVAAVACSADVALSVPGALIGDAIAPAWPAALSPSVIGVMRVSAPNVVSVRLCNLSSSSVAIASAPFRATVVHGL